MPQAVLHLVKCYCNNGEEELGGVDRFCYLRSSTSLNGRGSNEAPSCRQMTQLASTEDLCGVRMISDY